MKLLKLEILEFSNMTVKKVTNFFLKLITKDFHHSRKSYSQDLLEYLIKKLNSSKVSSFIN